MTTKRIQALIDEQNQRRWRYKTRRRIDDALMISLTVAAFVMVLIRVGLS